MGTQQSGILPSDIPLAWLENCEKVAFILAGRSTYSRGLALPRKFRRRTETRAKNNIYEEDIVHLSCWIPTRL
jgi:hypothetical protein